MKFSTTGSAKALLWQRKQSFHTLETTAGFFWKRLMRMDINGRQPYVLISLPDMVDIARGPSPCSADYGSIGNGYEFLS